MPLYLSFELLFRKFLRFVHPGCTFESLSLPARHLGQLPRFCPTDFSQLLLWDARQILMDGHQVIGFSSRVGKSLFEEIIKRFHLLEAPILPRPHFAQVTTQIYKPEIALEYPLVVPSEDLVDLAKDKHSPLEIEFWRHRRSPVNPQVRQASQG